MVEFVQHATSGFWVFVGTLILLWVIGYIIIASFAVVAAILRGR